ncbi:hypothetical protein [Lysobacter enzymogenes]|uniref:hypothetical protein n=1 Tax=Lysobacter enzymogenes TaxID=69 RepID=UPI0011144838|nr:hypothetical protein [Lysobacter enzymogenes]
MHADIVAPISMVAAVDVRACGWLADDGRRPALSASVPSVRSEACLCIAAAVVGLPTHRGSSAVQRDCMLAGGEGLSTNAEAGQESRRAIALRLGRIVHSIRTGSAVSRKPWCGRGGRSARSQVAGAMPLLRVARSARRP